MRFAGGSPEHSAQTLNMLPDASCSGKDDPHSGGGHIHTFVEDPVGDEDRVSAFTELVEELFSFGGFGQMGHDRQTETPSQFVGGAVVGGVLIGMAEMLFAGLVPTSLTAYRDAFVFVVLIVVLLVRPNGLFNVKEGGRS